MDEYGYGFAYGGGRALLHSQSCKSMIEQKEKDVKRDYYRIDAIIFALMVLIILILVIHNSNAPSYDRIELFPWTLPVICILGGLPSVMLYSMGVRPILDLYAQYAKYCNSEYLIVGDEKISAASLDSGVFQLGYDQIRSVDIRRNQARVSDKERDNEKYSINNYILHIVDASGRHYSFFSFTNSRELKFFIEEQMKKHGWTEPQPQSENHAAYTPPINRREKEPTQPVHIGSRPNTQIICPHCGYKQRPDRIVCFQCGCEFIFDE